MRATAVFGGNSFWRKALKHSINKNHIVLSQTGQHPWCTKMLKLNTLYVRRDTCEIIVLTIETGAHCAKKKIGPAEHTCASF